MRPCLQKGGRGSLGHFSGYSRNRLTDVSLSPNPALGKWECPWHQCDECGSAAISFCEFCPHSFCKAHEKGALVPSALEGRLCCSNHDPASPVSPEYWSKMRCKWESQDGGEEVKEWEVVTSFPAARSPRGNRARTVLATIHTAF